MVLSLHLGTYVDHTDIKAYLIDQIDGAGFQFDELNYSILNRIVRGRITAVGFSNIFSLDPTLRLNPLFRTGTNLINDLACHGVLTEEQSMSIESFDVR